MSEITYYAIPGLKGDGALYIKPFNVKSIIKATSDYFGISELALMTPNRKRKVVYPRGIALYLAKKYTHLSLKDIATGFGTAVTHHTSVIAAIREVENKLSIKDEATVEDINGLIQRINRNSFNA